MAGTALALSVIALIVSIAALAYARREAIATEHLRDTDRERRRDEQRPDLRWERRSQLDQSVVAELANYGPATIDRLEVEFPAGRQSWLPAVGFDAGQGPTTKLELPSLDVGASRAIEVMMASAEGGGQFRVLVTAHVGGDVWSYPVTEEFRPPRGSFIVV